MKKKIKDLTVAEVRRLCGGYLFCCECPLYRSVDEEQISCLINNTKFIPEFIPEWMLDEEIEISEKAE